MSTGFALMQLAMKLAEKAPSFLSERSIRSASINSGGGSPKRSMASRPQPASTSALKPAARSNLISSPRNSSTSEALRTTP
eukprot:scaffold6809_cov56-Phaeocystis_antarctica.AAC.3